MLGVPAMDLGSADIRWGGVVIGIGVSDLGLVKYAGTLVIDVPVGTNGTFRLGWNPEPASELQDEQLVPISPLDFASAIIRVDCVVNADCDDSSDCTQDSCDPARGRCSR